MKSWPASIYFLSLVAAVSAGLTLTLSHNVAGFATLLCVSVLLLLASLDDRA
jgi:hypothetical protein